MYALLLRNSNKLSRSPPCIYSEDSRWRIARGGLAVNQEQGATDSGIFNGRSFLTLFHRGRKRRRLIRGRRGDIFAKNFSFLGRQCRGISEVTKGRIRTKGARTLEQRTDNGVSKNIGAEKSPCTPHEHHSASRHPSLAKKIIREKAVHFLSYKSQSLTWLLL